MTDKIRKNENLHVLLWLIKDCCWMMDLRVPGTIMILPTIAMAAYVCYISKNEYQDLLPNLSVLCWIIANSFWMLFDFYNWQLKPISLVFFSIGFIIMLVYLYKMITKNKSTH